MKFDLSKFATETYPLHASQLHKLMECPLASVLSLLDEQSESGQAADTGSAVHKAVDSFHTKAAQDITKAIATMKAAGHMYPQADMERAEELFRHYAADERNQTAKVIQSECEVSFQIPPSEADPTQAPIFVKGTLDQVREINGRLVLHDIKTGKMHSGIDMLSVHALQLCAYQIGATLLLKRRVEDATIIRVQDYDVYVRGEKKGTRYGPVFWQALWKYDDCLRILDGVRHKVAQIRAGIVYAVPGPQCRWCDQMGLSNCLPRLHELGGES